MTKNSATTINQIIMVPCCVPFVFIAVNLLYPLFGIGNLDGTFPDADFYNHHIIGWWMLLFSIPYVFVFFSRNDENIFLPTKLAVSATCAVSLLDPLITHYNQLYFVLGALLTAGAVTGLFWKPIRKKHVDYGKYPLLIAPKKGYGFPTSSLHENVQIVGGTGTGKTHYVIKPFIEQTVKQGLGCFIYDVKGNMDKDVAYYASFARREYLHFNLVEPQKSHTYNPLYGNNPDAIANRVYTALYYKVNNGETYYHDLAEAFLRNLIGLLMMEIKTLTF